MDAPRHAPSGEVIDLHRDREPGDTLTSETLVRTGEVEVFRVVLKAGRSLHEHKAPNVITIQCLQGVVEIAANGKSQHVGTGCMVHFAGGETHALKALEDSVLLITMLLRPA